MVRPVEVHPDAILEAQAAYRWYVDRNNAAAEAFLAELDRAVELISENPMRWPIHLHGAGHFLLRRFPYGVIYRELAENLPIVAIAHGRRKPWYWKNG